MDFPGILNLRKSGNDEKSRPVFLFDLNIIQIIEKIESLYGEKIGLFYNYFPIDEECEKYRREIYSDICNPSVFDALNSFRNFFKDYELIINNTEHIHNKDQLSAMKLKEVRVYCDALYRLNNALKTEKLTSLGMKLFVDYLDAYISSEFFKQMMDTAINLTKQYDSVNISLVYDNGKLTVGDVKFDGAYENAITNNCGKTKKELKSPFLFSAELTTLETEIINIYKKKNPELFKALYSFYDKYFEYSDDNILKFADEVRFYLSFAVFEKNMSEKGFLFTIPNVSKDNIEANGLYDLALACKNIAENKPVVSNDFIMSQNEKFFVLTGPNQGGKTTFARSLGQLVFFTKIGLKVPASSASVPYFKNILTHFSVEESIETGRGKLKEELIRLSPMMNGNNSESFVIINELFTTAANYDACIMGKKVLIHFIEDDCKGIYVTHLSELASAHESVVGLSAMLDEHNIQSFKIERNIMGVKGCAANQVKKYRLSYSDLKERLS